MLSLTTLRLPLLLSSLRCLGNSSPQGGSGLRRLLHGRHGYTRPVHLDRERQLTFLLLLEVLELLLRRAEPGPVVQEA